MLIGLSTIVDRQKDQKYWLFFLNKINVENIADFMTMNLLEYYINYCCYNRKCWKMLLFLFLSKNIEMLKNVYFKI